MTRSVLLPLVCLLAAFSHGCRKNTPPAPPPAPQSAAQVMEIEKGKPMMFTFIEEKGTFASTDNAEEIPEKVRGMVKVVDPSMPESASMDTSRVWVADMREFLKTGKAQAQSLSREAFETSALAQLGPGESSPMAGEHGPPIVDDAQTGDAGIPGKAIVTLYGTPWCGACKSAKTYLSTHKIPFVYKDIENDPGAAKELSLKAAKMGIPTDRVPILDIRGRLMVGFDKTRLEALLGPTI